MLYVIRHGQTDWNLEKRTQGSIETELNDNGINQALDVKNKLLDTKIDVILCSPRKRCKATAEIINKDRNITIIEVESLRERGFGEFEGKMKDIDFNWEDFWNWEKNKKYLQAENIRDFFERIAVTMEKIKEEYIGKNVLIVTHSGVCAMIYCYFNNLKPDGKLKVPGIKNCELVSYDFE